MTLCVCAGQLLGVQHIHAQGKTKGLATAKSTQLKALKTNSRAPGGSV